MEKDQVIVIWLSDCLFGNNFALLVSTTLRSQGKHRLPGTLFPFVNTLAQTQAGTTQRTQGGMTNNTERAHGSSTSYTPKRMIHKL